jgi:hypothetical protein
MQAPAPGLVLWHRRDLRLHDNPLYSDLGPGRAFVIPIYIFDELQFQRRPCAAEDGRWDVAPTGPHQARFLVESVADLRASLRRRGSELLVRTGQAHVVLAALVRELQAASTGTASGVNGGTKGPLAVEVRWNDEPGTDEAKVSARVRAALQAEGTAVCRSFFSCALFHPDDLPRGEQGWRTLALPNQKYKKKKQSKKEWRRQHKRQQQQQATDGAGVEPEPGPAPGLEPCCVPRLPPQHAENAVDISARRFEGMSTIMGEWRRAARTANKPAVRFPAGEPEQWHLVPVPPQQWPPAGELPVAEQLIARALDDDELPPRDLFGLDAAALCGLCEAARASAQSARSAHGLAGGETAARARLEELVGGSTCHTVIC